MTLAALPEYQFLPAPLWLITTLHLLTLTLHFIAMNFMVGGIVTILFGKIDDRWNNPVVKQYLKLFPTIMAATVTLAVAPLLFTQLTYGGGIYAASIVSGWFWILVPIVVIVAYYFLYGAAFAKAGNPKVKGWMIVALACLIYVSLVQSSVFSMAERPELQKELYAANQSGLVLNSNVGEWIFRWLHMLTGAVTVGAFFVALLGRNHEQVFKAGRTFFVVGTVAAMLTGLVYMLSLGDHLKPFMKSSGIWMVTIGFVLSLASVHFIFKKKWLLSGLTLFVSVVTMVIARHVLRLVVMPYGTRPMEIYEGKVQPQWDVFGLFLVFFVIALALVYWMLKIFFSARPSES